MSGALAAATMVGGKTVQLINKNIFANTVSVNAVGTLSMTSAGVASSNGTLPFSYNWLLAGSGASYDVRVTPQGGTTLSASGSALSTWLPMSSDRSWSYSKVGVGEDTVDVLVEIRPTGGSAIASCTVHFDCTVN